MAKTKEKTSEYLNRVYGLDLNDMDLTEQDSIQEVNRQARKYGIQKMEIARKTFTLEKAMAIMRPFMK